MIASRLHHPAHIKDTSHWKLGTLIVLSLVAASACGAEGTRERYDGVGGSRPPPDQLHSSPDASAGSGGAPVTPRPSPEDAGAQGGSGGAPPEPNDGGPPNSAHLEWDASTTPSADHVRGVDASAGENERDNLEPP